MLKSFNDDSSNCAARLTLSRFVDGRLGRGVSSHKELNIQSGSKIAFVAGFEGFLVSEGFEEDDVAVTVESLDDVLDTREDTLGI